MPVFGIECDAEVFSWKDELLAWAEHFGRSTAPQEISGIEVNCLARDGLWFFEFQNAVYGVYDERVCRELIGRLRNLHANRGSRRSVSGTLSENRIYQRVASGFELEGETSLFVFLQEVKLRNLLLDEYETPRAAEYYRVDPEPDLVGTGFQLDFSSRRQLEFRLMNATTIPPREQWADLASLQVLDKLRDPPIPAGLSHVCVLNLPREAIPGQCFASFRTLWPYFHLSQVVADEIVMPVVRQEKFPGGMWVLFDGVKSGYYNQSDFGGLLFRPEF